MKSRDKKLEIKARSLKCRYHTKHARGIIPEHARLYSREIEERPSLVPEKFHFASAINNDRNAPGGDIAFLSPLFFTA